MGKPKSRAADRRPTRQERRSAKRNDHAALLSRVQEEEQRKPAKKGANRVPEPLTKAQKTYDVHILSKVLTFGIGPAGTGKTWWAAMRAAEMLDNKEIERIIITRPAVEAGEKLGFLPGELDEKYEPYFRPVREAFEDYFGSTKLEYLIEAGKIEARPLALIRGSTFKSAFIIADEMQNATRTQLKLFLTRIGNDSKVVVNGDPEQCDLPSYGDSGLMDAFHRLKGDDEVGYVEFDDDDCVRSGFCRRVLEAYRD